MNRVLFLSDKSAPQVEKWLEFMHGFKPDYVISVDHVRQYPEETVEERTIFHLNQEPLSVATNVPTEQFLEMLARPPYNLHNPWLKQFDAIIVTYFDVSKNDRFVLQVR